MGKAKKKNVNVYPFDIKKCPICERPVKSRGWYCPTCIKRTRSLNEYFMERFRLKYPVGKSMVARMSEMYPNVSNIFEHIYDNPHLIFTYFNLPKDKRKLLRESYKTKKNENDLLSLDNIPRYVLNYLRDREDLQLLNVNGKASAIEIRCRCLRCNNDYTVSWDELKKGFHRCDSSISSGECVVMRFLKEQGINYKSQYDTLDCRNPKTGHQLPYDFELVDRKVIIEVQGNQHKMFSKYFHTSEEAFEYQQFKDKVKREYAIRNGYQFIELFYDDFKKDKYKKIILERI